MVRLGVLRLTLLHSPALTLIHWWGGGGGVSRSLPVDRHPSWPPAPVQGRSRFAVPQTSETGDGGLLVLPYLEDETPQLLHPMFRSSNCN